MEVWRIGNTCTQHGSTGHYLECTEKICFTHSQDTRDIYHVIPCIYHVYIPVTTVLAAFLPTLVWQHRTATSVRSSQSWPQRGRPREAGAVQSSTARCWSRKHGCLSAPPRSRARTISTAALKSVPLSAAVLMWDSWGCISVQKAWNERDSAVEVVNSSDLERVNRWGLIYPVNSFRFHDSSSPQAKFLEGTEENQVKWNVFVRTVAAARRSTYGAQCTVEEQLGTHKPHTVQIK